jgi:hypothetical protein
MELLVIVGEQVLRDFFKVAHGVSPAVAVAVVGRLKLFGFLVPVSAGASVLVDSGVCSAFGGDNFSGHSYYSTVVSLF